MILEIMSSAKSGLRRIASRIGSRATTAKVLGSSVITEAERGLPSSAISPTYLAGPCMSRIISWPSESEMNTFTLPGEDHEHRVARVALGDEDGVLRIGAQPPEGASSLVNASVMPASCAALGVSPVIFFSGARMCRASLAPRACHVKMRHDATGGPGVLGDTRLRRRRRGPGGTRVHAHHAAERLDNRLLDLQWATLLRFDRVPAPATS
jgi:hypothetical protein